MPYQPGPLRQLSQALQAALTAPEKWLLTRRILSPERLTLPHFLGIGAQKAGTSWLYANLRRHPQLYLPDQKEVHFWDRRYHRSIHSYAAHFRQGRELLRGEITPGYSILARERIEFIHRLAPDLKLILLLRDPVERAWSSAVMALAKRMGRAPGAVEEEEYRAHFRRPNPRRKGAYAQIIQSWCSFYPREQIFIGFFERIAAEPEALLTDLFRFLEIDQPLEWDGYPLRERVNANPSTVMPPRLRAELQEMYREEIEELYQMLGEPVSAWRTAKSPVMAGEGERFHVKPGSESRCKGLGSS